MADVKKLMEALDLTEAEALQLIEDDKKIDKMTKLSDINADLTDEQKKAVKSLKNAGTRKKSAETVKKTVKNEQKEQLIAELFAFLEEKGVDNPQVTNKTRSIAFKLNGKSYDLTLIEHRK